MALIQSFSGIRGIFGEDLNEDIARRYSYCYYSFLKKKNEKPTVVIGNDPRHSSLILKKAIFDVFENIIDVGIATTPMIELAVREYKADGGIIITASHNEPEWNGFKFLDKDGAVLRPDDINIIINDFKKIKNLNETDFLNNYLYKATKIHRITKKHSAIIKKYSDFVLKTITKKNIKLIKKSKIKFILDPNGGSAIILKRILDDFGLDFVGVNMNYGEFNRLIEPNKESLAYLQKVIKENNADLAFGFDCDADRVEVVLPDGDVISGNYILALIVDDVLSALKKPEKETVVVNDATSNLVKEIADKNRANLKEVEVGEINVIDAMLNHNSVIGGEGSSSGIIFPPSRCRDGMLTLLAVLKIIAKRKKQLGGIIKEYPKYYNLKEKIEFDFKQHDKIKEELKNYYLKKGFKIKETGDITGGLKILIGDKSWIFFRASKTEEGTFRIIVDSSSKEKADELMKEAREIFKKFKYD